MTKVRAFKLLQDLEKNLFKAALSVCKYLLNKCDKHFFGKVNNQTTAQYNNKY